MFGIHHEGDIRTYLPGSDFRSKVRPGVIFGRTIEATDVVVTLFQLMNALRRTEQIVRTYSNGAEHLPALHGR